MKFDQIAIFSPRPREAEGLLTALGFGNADEWVYDRNKVEGFVHGQELRGPIEGQLSFNYGVTNEEFEVLHYPRGALQDSWLGDHLVMGAQPQPMMSHLGVHVDNIEYELMVRKALSLGLKIVQEVETIEHSNPDIPKNRRYRYCIIGTRHILGFDVKLILRLTRKSSEEVAEIIRDGAENILGTVDDGGTFTPVPPAQRRIRDNPQA